MQGRWQLVESNELMSVASMEDLIKDIDEDGILSSVLNHLKSLPLDTGSHNLQTPFSGSEILSQAFNGLVTSSSFYELVNETVQLTSKYNTEPAFYRNIRNASLEELNISKDYKQTQNPISEIDNVLQSSTFKKTFVAFVEENLKNYFKDKTPSRFEVFTNYYIALDLLGYYRDKVFKNLLQDSFHAFYGAHCDFFVTDDDNTYHKAKVIYEHFNIETTVCKSDEFVTQFYNKSILGNAESKPVTETIEEIIKHSIVLQTGMDKDFNPVEIYKPGQYIYSYFNRLQRTENVNKTISLSFYKNAKNSSSFYFFKEIETVTNKIVSHYGIDTNFLSFYTTETDTGELLDNKWKGRYWNLGYAAIELNMLEYPFGLTLSIDFK